MAWSAGSFTRAGGSTNWGDDRDANTEILASLHDTHDQDLADGINSCLNKNGENTPTTDVSWGSNKITNLATPTADADAATKLYVDTGSNRMVIGAFALGTTTISTSEVVEQTGQITIPSDWNTYHLEILGAFTISETTALSSSDFPQVVMRVREGTTTGGTIVASNQALLAYQRPDTAIDVPMLGFLTAETTTGALDFAITTDADTNSGFLSVNGGWTVKAFRLT